LDRDPNTGKRRQKWITVKGTKKEAERELNRLLVEADRGMVGAAPAMTSADFLAQWLKEHAEPNLSPKTYARYSGLVRLNIAPYIGRVRLDRLQPSHLLKLQAELREAPRNDGRPGKLSPTTRLHAHRVLHTALEYAVRWKLIPSNPAASVDGPSQAKREMRYFEPEQALAVLEAAEAEGPKWHAFFAVEMTTGLRLGEMIGLRWRDVNLNNGTLVVRQTIQRVPGVGRVTKAPKTDSSRRPVALGADVIALLRKHRAAQNELRLAAGAAWPDNDLVFPSDLGTPVEDNIIRKIFRRVCRRAGVEPIRFHDLRHTSASLLLEGGVDMKVISERLGHSSIRVTADLYSHVSARLQKSAADTIEGMLRRPKPADSADGGAPAPIALAMPAAAESR
jgi:integrase